MPACNIRLLAWTPNWRFLTPAPHCCRSTYSSLYLCTQTTQPTYHTYIPTQRKGVCPKCNFVRRMHDKRVTSLLAFFPNPYIYLVYIPGTQVRVLLYVVLFPSSWNVCTRIIWVPGLQLRTFLLLRGTILNRTLRTYRTDKPPYISVFTNNAWSY